MAADSRGSYEEREKDFRENLAVMLDICLDLRQEVKTVLKVCTGCLKDECRIRYRPYNPGTVLVIVKPEHCQVHAPDKHQTKLKETG